MASAIGQGSGVGFISHTVTEGVGDWTTKYLTRSAREQGSFLGERGAGVFAENPGAASFTATMIGSGLTIGLSLIGAAVGMTVYRQTVKESRENCLKQLNAEVCAGKKNYCYWDPKKDASSGFLGGIAKWLGVEDKKIQALPPSPVSALTTETADCSSNAPVCAQMHCLVMNNSSGKPDVSGDLYANMSPVPNQPIQPGAAPITQSFQAWQGCCDPFSLFLKGTQEDPSHAKTGTAFNANSCLPQHCVGPNSDQEQCFSNAKYTPNARNAHTCCSKRQTNPSNSVPLPPNANSPTSSCDTGTCTDCNISGCANSLTTYFGCASSVKSWLLTQAQNGIKTFPISGMPNFYYKDDN